MKITQDMVGRELFEVVAELEMKPKEPVKVKMAPAFYNLGGGWQLSPFLFSSEEQAKAGARYQVIWPAIPDEDGFYSVPE